MHVSKTENNMFAALLACINCSCNLNSMVTMMMIIITANTCVLVISFLKGYGNTIASAILVLPLGNDPMKYRSGVWET